jgi:hypothetical protein
MVVLLMEMKGGSAGGGGDGGFCIVYLCFFSFFLSFFGWVWLGTGMDLVFLFLMGVLLCGCFGGSCFTSVTFLWVFDASVAIVQLCRLAFGGAWKRECTDRSRDRSELAPFCIFMFNESIIHLWLRSQKHLE